MLAFGENGEAMVLFFGAVEAVAQLVEEIVQVTRPAAASLKEEDGSIAEGGGLGLGEGSCGGVGKAGLGGLEGDADAEGSAGTRFAGQLNASAHTTDQALDDGQTDAHATELASGSGILLMEGAKQIGTVVVVNTDAGIGDDEVEDAPDAAVTDGDDFEMDMALGGEFDGVGEEVGKDLAQAEGIALKRFAEEMGTLGMKGDTALAGFFFWGFGNFADEFGEGKRAQAQFEAMGLDTRVVEDVGDEIHEFATACLDNINGFALGIGQVALGEQVGEADDGIHGSEDFVAENGEEFAFGLIGGFGGFLGAFKFGFNELVAKVSPQALGNGAEDGTGVTVVGRSREAAAEEDESGGIALDGEAEDHGKPEAHTGEELAGV